MARVLIVCTGNSVRSQMAEAFLRKLDPTANVQSAGTMPASRVHPYAVEVMAEVGIDISRNRPKLVDEFVGQAFDYVITVCDDAAQACPTFQGRVRHTLHLGFEDPSAGRGTPEEMKAEFRRVRDEIRERFEQFAREELCA